MKPIIFIHFGDRDYLPLTLSCARKFNPEAPIYLLGDDANEKYKDIITHDYYSRYEPDEFLKFKKKFRYISNMSDKPFFQKMRFFCISRWFRIYEFMQQKGIDQAWYFDSDTFICQDLSQRAGLFQEHEMTIINRINGCVSCINSRDALKKYMNLAIELFCDKKFLSNQTQIAKSKKTPYALCDMTIWGEYRKRISELGEASRIIDGETFDPFWVLDRPDQIEKEAVWEMSKKFEKRGKEIIFIDGIPYCFHIPSKELIRMNTLNMSWTYLGFKKWIWGQLCK